MDSIDVKYLNVVYSHKKGRLFSCRLDNSGVDVHEDEPNVDFVEV